MLAGRAILRRAAYQPCSAIQRRHLTLQGQRAVDFLKPLLYVSKTKSYDDKITTEFSDAKNSLAVLIHADRRKQTYIVPTDPYKTPVVFFGPSLIVCPFRVLERTSPGFGPGDLGILRAQRFYPDKVLQVPLYKKGKYLSKELSALKGHQRTAEGIPRDSEGINNTLAGLFHKLNAIFHDHEAVYFAAQLSFTKRTFSIHAPFFEIDDFAVHRIEALKEISEQAKQERDDNTAQAEDGGLFYRKLHNGGKVGSFGYGAGNAMATMDGLAQAGGTPANFLDGGGGANVANARLAIETLHRDPDVTSIFVNTFGGLTRCSLVAEGIIQAVKENDIKTPMTIRLMGTEADEAKDMLRGSGLSFTIEDDFKTAAGLAVSQAK